MSDAMTPFIMSPLLGIVLVLTSAACERQDPAPKPIGSSTNKHVEESPAASSTRMDTDAMIQKMKTPIENAGHTENLLKGAADRTRQQADQISP